MGMIISPATAIIILLQTCSSHTQAHSSHGGLGDTMDYDEGRDLDSPMDIITQLIGSITASIGIGEDIIKTSKKNLKTKTEAVSEAAEEEDYEAVASNSVYPQCVGSQAHVCRLNADPILCGTALPGHARIVNGKMTSAGSYPWTVGIQFGDKLYCGGSIITNNFIVTAAHCVKGINPRNIKLVIGDHDRTETEPFQEIRTIERVFIRPDFVKRTFNNDIALIKLNRKLQFSDHIRPVCLPKLDRSYNGQNTTVVGWGKLSEGGDPADVLMEVTVPVITQKKCRRHTRYRSSEITENMMCAGYDDGVLDACQGDSGGPMIWRNDDNHPFTQIGIVSWGQGCARKGYPGVYTRLGRYIDWIIETVSDHNSCFCQSS